MTTTFQTIAANVQQRISCNTQLKSSVVAGDSNQGAKYGVINQVKLLHCSQDEE